MADPFLRHLRARWVPNLPTYAQGGAVGLYVDFWDRPDLIVTGPVDAAAAVTRAAVSAGIGDAELSVPHGAVEQLVEDGFTPGIGWTFRSTETVPPEASVDDVAWLDRTADDELRELLAAGFPDASMPVGHPDVRRWAGLRRDGRLVACAADATVAPGVGFLASITSHPDARGTGAGAAVSAWATAELVREEGIAALWHMTDNVVAAALYTRLGYRDEHPMQLLERAAR